MIGFVPAVGSGWSDLVKTGQDMRMRETIRQYVKQGPWKTAGFYDWMPEVPAAGSSDALRFFGTRRPYTARGGFLRPFHDFAGLWRDVNLLRPFTLLGAIPCITARVRYGTPYVLTIGADHVAVARQRGEGRQRWKWRLLQSVAVRLAAATIVRNPAHAEILRSRYPRANMVTIPNWVDTDLFSPMPGGPRSRSTVVLYVGRLTAEKGLIEAARLFRKLGYSFVCVGEGPGRRALDRQGAHAVGAVQWTALPDIYRSADVFLLPSQSEGHPKALSEAMACGVPCIVRAEVAQSLRLPAETVVRFNGSLAAALQVALEPAARRTIGTQAADYVLANWAKEKVLAEEIALCAGHSR